MIRAPYSVELRKVDGRALTLYARTPFSAPEGPAPSPSPDAVDANPHLRWHPLRGEWVTYAAYRQHRTFLPPPQWNPLAPTRDAAHPTELPAGDWEVAVFDNRFPSLAPGAHDAPESVVPTAPARGQCEVVVFGQDGTQPLGAMPVERIALVLRVLADRCARLAARPGIEWVLPFENRGVEMGVTLHHPHGQIYAYPMLPPVAARMAAVAREHARRHGTGPLTAMIGRELASGERIVHLGRHAVAFVPACARYPFETWVAPIEAASSLADLDDDVLDDLAAVLKSALRRLDALWDRPCPYLMAWYVAPPRETAGWHVHAEIWPPYRARDRLKYLAGTELAAGLYAMDALPEEGARTLRAIDLAGAAR